MSVDSGMTVDRFLGGRVEAVQPDGGSHRSGLEAVLLGAAVDAGFDGALVDLGSGCGVAGMCVAARCRSARVTLVDRDATALAAAEAALARPANRDFAGRVSIVTADVTAPEPERLAAGLGRAVADAVILNPPFHDPERGTHSPHRERAAAHILGAGGLDPWLRTAASVLKPGGDIVVIFRADDVAGLMAALAGRFGNAAILPLHPRPDKPAHRILVRAIKGNRGPTAILPGLALHGATGSTYLPAAEAILRDGAALADVHAAWRR